MRNHPFTELSSTIGSIDEIYTFDGDLSKLEEFVEGTQYRVMKKIRSAALIQNVRHPDMTEQIMVGTHLIKPLKERSVCFIYDGALYEGYSKRLMRVILDSNDSLFGLDIRGWTNDYCRVIDKNGELKTLFKQELGPESEWLNKYDLVILNKKAWMKFREDHPTATDDGK